MAAGLEVAAGWVYGIAPYRISGGLSGDPRGSLPGGGEQGLLLGYAGLSERAISEGTGAWADWSPADRNHGQTSPGIRQDGVMATWRQIEQDAPEFAARVRSRFDAGTNKTIATVRRDGAPRISASELTFADGEATLGMMSGSVKLLDVRRDPRIAVHSPTIEPPAGDPDAAPGDAKLAGTVVGIAPPADNPYQGAGFFKLDITEVALTYVGTPADHLVIESWHADRGWQRRTRR